MFADFLLPVFAFDVFLLGTATVDTSLLLYIGFLNLRVTTIYYSHISLYCQANYQLFNNNLSAVVGLSSYGTSASQIVNIRSVQIHLQLGGFQRLLVNIINKRDGIQ